MKAWTPRSYQDAMVDFALQHPRVNLLAGMGTGKTSTVLKVIDLLMLAGEVRRTLVVAPKRVALSVWPDEVREWADFRHLTVAPAIGTAAQRIAALKSGADIITINYENLEWLIETLGNRWFFDMVVPDEATKLKGFRGSMRVSKNGKKFVTGQGSKRALALARAAHSPRVRRWINLSGTWASNGLIDTWGPQWFVDGGKALGRTFGAFEERWFQSVPRPDGYAAQKPREFAEQQIHAAIRPTSLSVQAKDFMDLPPLVESVIAVELPASARKAYDQFAEELYAELKAGTLSLAIEAFNAASKTGKLLQIASGAVYTDELKNWIELHDAKIEALRDVVEEAGGSPVLVAYHWKHDLVRLRKAFPRGRTLDDNPETIRQWNRGEIPMLFAHPQSCGHGLQLHHGGHHIAYFSSHWSTDNDAQILERIGPTRQAQAGYNRPVHRIRIVGKDTLEQTAVLRRLATNCSVMQAVMDAMGISQRG